MKFTMYEKESKNEKYRNDPYRAVNFPINESGLPVCPNGNKFHFIYSRPVRGNKYGEPRNIFSARIAATVLTRKNAASARETGSSV